MFSNRDFFQCLVCHSFYDNLWKVERHISNHDDAERERALSNRHEEAPGRRRGMLPIKKATFVACSVPVVKNQIDPAFLANYSSMEANDDEADSKIKSEPCTPGGSSYQAEIEGGGSRRRKGGRPGAELTKLSSEEIDEAFKREPRSVRLNARNQIRKVTAVLTIPDQEDADSDEREEMDFIESVLKDSYYSDGEYVPYFYKDSSVKRPRGRPRLEKPDNPNPLGKRPPGRRRPKLEDNSEPVEARPRRRKRRIGQKKPENESKNVTRTCEYCNETVASTQQLYRHILTEHRHTANLILCPLSTCNRPFVNFYTLSDHIRLHVVGEETEQLVADKIPIPPSQKFRCKYCTAIFENFQNVQLHVQKTHSKDSILKCPCCDLMFENDVSGLIGHIKLIHPDSLDPFGERLKRAEEYAKQEKKFKCDKCHKAYIYRSLLDCHILEAHEESKEKRKAAKPFSCPVCHKGFTYKDNLRRHFTLHLENNPFTCDFPNCNKKFNSDYNLRRHKTLHFESTVPSERVFCPICNASFCRKDKLPGHMRSRHTPDEITNAGPSRKNFRQARLLPSRRIPRYPKYPANITPELEHLVNPTTLKIAGNNPTNNNTDAIQGHIKTENIEEIHLVDKIVLGSDGNAIHVKGEQLKPEPPQPPISDDMSSVAPVLSTTLAATGNNNSQVSTSVYLANQLTKIIKADPVFKKLNHEERSVKNLIPRHHNYHYKTFTCEHCQATFTRAWTLQLHLRATHNKSLLDESQEKKMTSSPSKTESQTDSAAAGVTLMCGTCAYMAKSGKDLERHMRTAPGHVKIRKHPCHICGIRFTSQKRVFTHIQEIHNGAHNHLCRYCQKPFAKTYYRRAHERKVHENSSSGKKKRCPTCQSYLAPSSFHEHMKRHEAAKEPPPKCMLCGDSFACQSSLKRHIDLVHLGKPLKPNQKTARKRVPGSIRRRGTGPMKEPEWFESLLKDTNAEPTDCDANDDCQKNASGAAVESPKKECDSEENAISILGF